MRALLNDLIKLCRFSKRESDTGQFPIQQVEYLEKTGDSFVVLPYGMHANIPADFLGLLLSAKEQDRFVIPLSSKERVHPVASGELVLFHPVTGSKVHFKNNGDIDIETAADINATCNNINVSAAAKATVTAPDIALIGDVAITGTLSISDAVTAASSVAVAGALTQGGKDVGKDHTHSQGNDSGGNTEQNTGGVV